MVQIYFRKFRVKFTGKHDEVGQKKPASYLHRTAQPHTLAIFRSWGSSVGAGRIRLAGCKYRERNLKLI